MQYVVIQKCLKYGTVHTNQVTEFKSVTLINNVLTKQWHLDKALDGARVRVDCEELLPNKKRW